MGTAKEERTSLPEPHTPQRPASNVLVLDHGAGTRRGGERHLVGLVFLLSVSPERGRLTPTAQSTLNSECEVFYTKLEAFTRISEQQKKPPSTFYGMSTSTETTSSIINNLLLSWAVC